MTVITGFREEALEDILVENIKALDRSIAGKRVYVDTLEGNHINPNNPESAMSFKQTPSCIIGITGIPSTEAQDNQKTSYRVDFDLAVIITAYDNRRDPGSLSDVRTLRELIRKEIYGNNLYEIGNSKILLEWKTDDQLITTENKIAYVQTYTGKFFEQT